MSWEVRQLGTTDVEFEAFAALVSAVTPEEPTTLEELRWEDATYPGQGGRYVVEHEDRVVGAATVGRIFSFPPGYERYWLGLWVAPSERRQGIGSALYRAASRHARDAGKTGFLTEVSEARPETIDFLLHRGFEEHERTRSVRLDLAGLPEPAVEPPPGYAVTSLGERPELVPGVHAVAVAAFPDIPHPDEPLAVGSLEEFRARDVDRPGIVPEAFAVALGPDGSVAGYASLMLVPGSDRVAWHDMTAVHPDHRGHGLATALKRATIAWAVRNGLEALETGNDVANAPMRAVNAHLGYRPIPDAVGLRGPLDPGIMDR